MSRSFARDRASSGATPTMRPPARRPFRRSARRAEAASANRTYAKLASASSRGATCASTSPSFWNSKSTALSSRSGSKPYTTTQRSSLPISLIAFGTSASASSSHASNAPSPDPPRRCSRREDRSAQGVLTWPAGVPSPRSPAGLIPLSRGERGERSRPEPSLAPAPVPPLAGANPPPKILFPPVPGRTAPGASRPLPAPKNPGVRRAAGPGVCSDASPYAPVACSKPPRAGEGPPTGPGDAPNSRGA